jgi:hypothetical protein
MIHWPVAVIVPHTTEEEPGVMSVSHHFVFYGTQ